ncbi:MAG: hypothetical protein AB1782_05600 [Cyanobacteriota bacterium]
MTYNENEATWRFRIQQKVRKRTSAFKVSFAKAHPISGRLHPEYPGGNFIILTFMNPHRYSPNPPHIFITEEELDNFLKTFL